MENIVGKGAIARYEQLLLFLQCFQKLSVLMRQNGYSWSKGLKTLVCGGRGSNPQPPAHEADAPTTWPPWQLSEGSTGQNQVDLKFALSNAFEEKQDVFVKH